MEMVRTLVGFVIELDLTVSLNSAFKLNGAILNIISPLNGESLLNDASV